MQTVCVVSDLHLFCRRSRVHLHMEHLQQAIGDADFLILNGDTFDFRWTTMDTIEETVHEAIRWLDEIAMRHPHCHIHYVVGNHDNVMAFVRALDEYAAIRPNVSWHPHYVRLGNALFLHGDVADRRMNSHQLTKKREKWHDDSKKAKLFHRVYDVAFALRVHKAVHHVAFPSTVVAKRLMHYLESIGEGPDSGTEDVYFGHTHLALSDYEHKGVRFHNSGAPMPGLEFKILKVPVNV